MALYVLARAAILRACEVPTLRTDLDLLRKYIKQWRFKPNPAIIECLLFHLNNKKANHELHLQYGGQEVKYYRFPKYLEL